MKKRFLSLFIAISIIFTNSYSILAVDSVEQLEVFTDQDVYNEIELLPETMLDAENVEATYLQAVNIKSQYDELADEDKEKVTNYSKLEELLNANSSSLNCEYLNVQEDNYLKDKTIGYLGSSITVGYQSESVSFPDYIAKLTGSHSIKQAITGGPLAKVDGVRDEISYITQLLNGSLTEDTSLDALVVQLSTNDASLGIELGELSQSMDLDDFDYSTSIGAMEYIIAYAKQTWNCPVMFYTNPYLSDEVIQKYADKYQMDFEDIKASYQTNYQNMVDALYQVKDKWNIDVIDMWNEESFINTNITMRDYYMADPIHPTKAGYLFWYTPYIQNELISVLQENEFIPSVDLTKSSDTTYTYNASNEGYSIDYSDCLKPVYYVYGGNLSEYEAEKLLDEMKIANHLHEWAASITVVNPISGSEYTSEDADVFIKLLGAGVSNIKVIGIDDGATFVNNYISQRCYAVAGIMTYNGTMKEGLQYNVCVPTYLSQATQIAKDYYIKANDAIKVNDNLYENEIDPLQRVSIGENETLAKAFENAWNNVFSKNYRQHNEKTEFYMADTSTYTEPYLLINIANYDELNIQYNPIYNTPLNGEGKYTWFEYVPKSILNNEKGTVPLVISLHGNGNDARLQGETTGWVELASEEEFIVMAPEWQDVVYDSSTHEPGPNYFNCDGLEGDKLIEWIEMLEEKYPQIDKNRIYITGLSAGGSASELYGIKYSDTFAAVGAVSAPAVDGAEITELANKYDGDSVPLIYLCGDHDFFGMIPVDLSSQNSFQVGENLYIQNVDNNCVIFPVIQAFQKINKLTVSQSYDLSLNPYYGIQLDNQQWVKLGVKDTLEGTLSNEDGIIMKFAAIKNQAHWNYKPEAQYIWNFFKNYSKDSQPTINTNVTNTTTNTTENTTSTIKPVSTSDNMEIVPYVLGAFVSIGGVIIILKKKKYRVL